MIKMGIWKVLCVVLLFGVADVRGQKAATGEVQLIEGTLIARDIIKSASWYVRNLNFKVKESKREEYAIIENGHFRLRVITAKRTITAGQVRMPEKKERINGFYELGFLCSDLDSLMYQYEGRDIRRLTELEYDEDYKTSTVVLADPDGNRVKLFQATSAQKKTFNYFKANYLAITTSDVETSVRWYQTHLGFEEVSNNYSRSSSITFSLLRRGDVLLELQELAGKTMEITELLSDQIELTRLDVVTLGTVGKKERTDITDNDGNKLRF